jgi:acylphosphatase
MSIHGRVQGVGFRYFVRQAARELGVKGWVRNRGDGSVELEASGPEERLEIFIARIKRGPRMSRVSKTFVTHVECPDHSDDFEIAPTTW